MDWRKALIAVFVLLMVFSLAAYDGSGNSNSDGPTACTDGLDNDGDGLTDSNDPGCVKPYSADDSEGNVYDLDASWVFSDESAPTDSGPSIYQGWEVVEKNVETFTDEQVGGSLREYYVENAGSLSDGNWGSGIVKSVDFSTPSEGKIVSSGETGVEIVDKPIETTCGDGIQQADENRYNCPQDSGLPPADLGQDPSLSTPLDCRTSSSITRVVDDGSVTSSNKDVVNGDLDKVAGDALGFPATSLIQVACPDRESDFRQVGSLEYEEAVESSITVPDGKVVDGSPATSCPIGSKCYYDTCSKDGNYNDIIYSESSTDASKNLNWDIERIYYTYSGSNSTFQYNKQTQSSYSTESQTVTHATDTNTINVQYDQYSCTEQEVDCTASGGATGSSCPVPEGEDTASKDYTGDYSTTTKTVNYYVSDPVVYTTSAEQNVNSNTDGTDQSGQVENQISNGESVTLDTDSYHAGGGDDSNMSSNDESSATTTYRIWTDPTTSTNWMEPTSSQVVDADDRDGQGEGLVAIRNGAVVGTTADMFSSIPNDVFTQSDLSISCPGSRTKCVAAVDSYIAESGWSPSNSSNANNVVTDVRGLDASLGTCEMYKVLSGDQTVDCRYDSDTDGPTPATVGPCGDEPNEYWAYMEGPEVDEAEMSNWPAHYEACVSKTGPEDHFQCVYNGNPVDEGTMRNVADDNNRGYEAGQNSVDLEVCLDIPNEGDDVSGDNPNGNDYGGEWYDLDDPAVQNYMRSGGGGNYLVGQDTTNTSHISYYWQTNPGMNSGENPQGGNSGTALEDDCQTTINCGDNEDSLQTGNGLYYSWFEEGKRDEDYHPQGESSGSGSLEGYMNRMHDLSNQLEPGMDTSTYNMMDPNSGLAGGITWERDSNGSDESADTWAITEDLQAVLSNEGVPYNPFSTYYETGATVRTQPSDDGIPKQTKIFGNSYAAVAASNLDGETDDNGVSINQGDGIWIDPDNLKQRVQNDEIQLAPGASTWTYMLQFQMDISGPDSGLGYDNGDGSSLTVTGSNNGIVWGDIYFEGEDDNIDNDGDGSIDENGETHTRLEKSMCGDDRYEYLVEEMGESNNPEQYEGEYACASRKNMCVDTSASGSPLFEEGEYRQTDEPGENDGRLKNDREVCTSLSDTSGYIWFDQDYGDLDGDGTQDTCRQNNLYGSPGVRWFNQNYVNTYPDAVSGGIDDDWNSYLSQKGYSTVSSSVPNGVTYNNYKATVGFCGGDDEGEHIVTQECNPQNNLCSTKRKVMGVAENPQKCVFDGEISQYSPVDSSKENRLLYSPGDTITLDLAQPQTIACFNGVWYEKWPVTFTQNTVDIPLGENTRIPFRVINVRDEETTFEVNLEEGSEVYRFSKFVEKEGNSFETTVSAQSSKTFNVEVQGTDLSIDHSDDNLVVYAEALNSEVEGEDDLSVDVVNNTAVNGTIKTGQPKSVPGITMIQIAVLFMISSIVVWLQS